MRLFLLLFLIALPTSPLVAGEPKTDNLIIIGQGGREHEFLVEVAKTAEEKVRGLMFRHKLEKNRGMLFLYEKESHRLMWMKNTFISLDMLFINKDGLIIHIVKQTIPFSLATISSNGSALAVLELCGGITSKLNIAVGNRIKYPAFVR